MARVLIRVRNRPHESAIEQASVEKQMSLWFAGYPGLRRPIWVIRVVLTARR
jgi:hypothetical protein